MRINEHHVKRYVGRFLGILFFAAFVCVVSDCQAQRQRGWLTRNAPVNNSVRQQDRAQPTEVETSRPSPRYGILGAPHPNNRQIYDVDENFPKFIGGFHSSHFSNLGIPTGDLGFRGNGVYWAPW